MNKLLIILQIILIAIVPCIGNAENLSGEGNKIGFEITEKWTEWTVEIKDKNGVLRKGFKGLNKGQGNIILYWDGKDGNGNMVEDGSYDYKVKLYWDAASPATELIAAGDVMEAEGTLYSSPETEYYLKAKDRGRPKSGIRAIYYKVNNNEWLEYNDPIKIDEEGSHTISYRAKDMAGNMEKAHKISVIIDNDPPEIIVTGPEDKEYYNHEIKIGVEIKDESPLAMSSIVLDDRMFINNEVVSEEGSHNIVVKAEDIAKNPANRSVVFNIDRELPLINIIGVSDGGTYSEARPIIEVMDENLLNIEVYLNDELIHETDEDCGSSYKYELESVTEIDEHTLLVIAEDKAHNKTEKEINFSIEELEAGLLFYVSYDKSADADIAAGSGNAIFGGEITSEGEGINGTEALSALKKGVSYNADKNIDEAKGTVMMWLKPLWKNLNNDQAKYFFSLNNNCKIKDAKGKEANDSVNEFSINLVFTKSKGLTVQIKDAEGNIYETITEENIDWYTSGEWTHLAFGWDSELGEIKLYIDGEENGEGEGLTEWTPKKMSCIWAGSRHKDAGKSSESNIDEFKIYNKMLTGSEIKKVMNE